MSNSYERSVHSRRSANDGASLPHQPVQRRSEDRGAERAGSVIRGDALDVEFWGRLRLDPRIELVVLAMSDHAANLVAVRRVKEFLPQVHIAATATHTDEIMELEELGVDVARNLYGEAGQGLADDACNLLDIEPPTTREP
ncbi:MAG: NAD-binding protein [Acidimicrobiia bacterium]|nr:NAD-binding protein [Acidimicrobiia bacterium]